MTAWLIQSIQRWLPILVSLWGIVTTLTSLVRVNMSLVALMCIFNPPKVHNYSGLLAIRIFLGFCEGGLLPGMVNTLQLGHTPGLNFTAPRSFTSVQSIPVMSCNYGKRTYPIVRFLYSFYSLEWEYSMHLVRLNLFYSTSSDSIDRLTQ